MTLRPPQGHAAAKHLREASNRPADDCVLGKSVPLLELTSPVLDMKTQLVSGKHPYKCLYRIGICVVHSASCRRMQRSEC